MTLQQPATRTQPRDPRPETPYSDAQQYASRQPIIANQQIFSLKTSAISCPTATRGTAAPGGALGSMRRVSPRFSPKNTPANATYAPTRTRRRKPFKEEWLMSTLAGWSSL